MNEISTCILCEGEAIWEAEPNEDVNFVKCETCGKYYLNEPSMSVGYYREEVPREEKAMLSAYTREKSELGEKPPVLRYPHGLEEIISSYENKTLDEKLENLIWYIRKKSPQFGDSVLLETEKDYPLTYSLSPEGFTEILNNAIGQRLIESTESGFKLTEKGWKMGTDSLKNDKEFKDIIIKAVHNANFSRYNELYKNLEEEIVFEVTTAKGKKYIIVAHYWDPERCLISEQVEKYFNRTRKSEIPYIIVTNALGLTQEAHEDLEEFNKIFKEQKLFVIFGSNEDELIKKFLNL